MKIALVSEHASPLAVVGGADAGGQNVHVASLAGALARRGHHVVVYTRRDDPELPQSVHTATGYLVRHIDAGPAVHVPKDELLPWMPVLARGLAAWWAVDRPDVVHAHFWMSGLAAVDAAAGLDIPVALTFHALGAVKRRHQGDADTSPEHRIALERRLCDDVDRIVATCSDEVFELRRGGWYGDTVDVIPCGVDLDRFSPDGAVAPRRSGAKRIVSVARLVPRKGLRDVVTAVGLLPDTELLIAGGSPDPADRAHAEELLALAEALGVRQRVRLLGSVPRSAMPALMRSADVVVHAPWYEPFGIVPLEAMASGRPVVATAVGGLIDTVVDGETGLHVRPHEPDSIAAAVASLLADDAARLDMGRRGAQRARRRYGWDRVAGQTEAVYARLASHAALAVDAGGAG